MKKSIFISFLTVLLIGFYASSYAQQADVAPQLSTNHIQTALKIEKEFVKKAKQSLTEKAELAFYEELDAYYANTYELKLEDLEEFLFDKIDSVIVYDENWQVVFRSVTEGDKPKKHELPAGASFLMHEGSTDYYVVF